MRSARHTFTGQALLLDQAGQLLFGEELVIGRAVCRIAHSSHSPMLATKATSQSPPIMTSFTIITGHPLTPEHARPETLPSSH